MIDDDFKEVLLKHIEENGRTAKAAIDQMNSFSKQLDDHDRRAQATADELRSQANTLKTHGETLIRIDERQLAFSQKVDDIGLKTDRAVADISALRQKNKDQDGKLAALDGAVAVTPADRYQSDKVETRILISEGTMKWIAISLGVLFGFVLIAVWTEKLVQVIGAGKGLIG